jgi:hypothetical protein
LKITLPFGTILNISADMPKNINSYSPAKEDSMPLFGISDETLNRLLLGVEQKLENKISEENSKLRKEFEDRQRKSSQPLQFSGVSVSVEEVVARVADILRPDIERAVREEIQNLDFRKLGSLIDTESVTAAIMPTVHAWMEEQGVKSDIVSAIAEQFLDDNYVEDEAIANAVAQPLATKLISDEHRGEIITEIVRVMLEDEYFETSQIEEGLTDRIAERMEIVLRRN